MAAPFYFPPDDFKAVLEAERVAIADRSERLPEGAWTGISLSGGGIRSAAFCLGALQTLAGAGWLSKMDYVSTVSGGGYIGGGIQWLLHRNKQTGSCGAEFPYGIDAQLSIQSEHRGQTDLQYLRWHANYLLPGGGLTIFSALAVVLRTALLSLAIWLPILTLGFLLIQTLAALPDVMCAFERLPIPSPLPKDIISASWDNEAVTKACENWAGGVDYALKEIRPDMIGHLSPIYAMCLYLSYFCVVILLILTLLFSLVSISSNNEPINSYSFAYAILCALCAALPLWMGIETTIYLFTSSPDFGSITLAIWLVTLGLIALFPAFDLLCIIVLGNLYNNAGYFSRRWFEILGGNILKILIFLIVLGTIPVMTYYLSERSAVSKIGGVVSGLAGLVSAVVGHLMQSRKVMFGAIGHVLTALLAAVFLYAVLIIAFAVSSFIYNPENKAEVYGLEVYKWQIIFTIFATIAVMFGSLSNSNATGLHRFYRDRLMELFMPSAESVRKGVSAPTYEADRLSVRQLWRGTKSALNLYPIINCNAILINDKKTVVARRGGANFSITPLHIGSSVHGWEESGSYERKNREMTLATAVAASGAAASPNAGYVGTGVTRNRAVSLVLMLLNIRLGVWVRRPSGSNWRNVLKPTPFFPTLWYGFLGTGYKAASQFVELSDGGHFENLGIYELVRRRVDLIVAFDGEADPNTALPALSSLTRRIEEDFGAILDFGDELDALIPKIPPQAKYPSDAKYSDLSFARGTITYADDTSKKTAVIYVKASLVKNTPFAARGYRAQHPDFPNEPTSDQFYSPEQFDAYRELGQQCAKEAVSKHKDVIQSVCARRGSGSV